jgi:tRNA A-37 threonylcarbamoyl transferase component Bud32
MKKTRKQILTEMKEATALYHERMLKTYLEMSLDTKIRFTKMERLANEHVAKMYRLQAQGEGLS